MRSDFLKLETRQEIKYGFNTAWLDKGYLLLELPVCIAD